jgi:transcription initiation factor TFIIIB Brf1 subunit/transcription initiation factor TFIIB
VKCIECSSTESSFDDRLGYHICSDCGFVLNVEMFEETSNVGESDSKYGVGSIIQLGESTTTSRKYNLRLNHLKTETKSKFWSEGDIATHNTCMMYLSPYKPYKLSLRREIEFYYQELQRNRILIGLPTEVRAAGLAYFILKDESIFVSLKSLQKTSGVHRSKIMKASKKIAKFYRKSHIFGIRDIHDVVTICLDKSGADIKDRSLIYNFVDYVSNYYETVNVRVGNGEIAGAVYIASKMLGHSVLQRELASTVNISEVTLRIHIRKICELIQIERTILNKYNINKIIGGIRNE